MGMKDSFGVDCKLPSQLRSPIIKYDLLKSDHVALVQQLISSPQCIFVHFAPPCGTSSRARLIQRPGRWNPPIVRTDQHPNGIPGLTGTLHERVQAANQLYDITCQLAKWCIAHDKYISIENPGRSFMWQTTPFVALVNEYNLSEVSFHHCQYGSARRKLTKLLHNVPTFKSLEAFCANDHIHEPWGQSSDGSWRTAEETAYPWALCKAMTLRIVQQLQADGISCSAPVFATQEANLQTLRATTDIQPRRGLPPMVSEFKTILRHPINQAMPPLARRLSTPPIITPSTGVSSASAGDISDQDQKGFITIGIHRTPEEFVKEAIAIGHPTRLHSMFPDEIAETIHKCLSTSPSVMALERTEEMKRWISLAEQFKEAETTLQGEMSERRRSILSGKRLTLLRTLLLEAGHPDTTLVNDLANGFDLTGALPESNTFEKRVKPASISCEELRRVARLGRESMFETTKSSGDTELDEQLYAATQKEVMKGFIEGPLDPMSLPEESTLTRRFGVKQKSKTRPIDDYKSSFVNSSVAQSETASVHTVDHIASMVACTMRVADSMCRRVDLTAKAWDLADAYKQVPLSEEAYALDSFLVVYSPATGGPEVYRQKVLPFGSVASVTAFLRVSLGLWKLGTKLLTLMWSAYFDDFFSVTAVETQKHTDLVITSLFSILGWRLSTDKLLEHDSVCKVLGVKFDMRQSGAGLTLVCNTEDRIAELCAALDEVTSCRKLRRSDGERLRGRLLFASGQLFGRRVRNHVRILSQHIHSGRTDLTEETLASLTFIREHIHTNEPHRIMGPLSDHVHVYVDASFDDAGYSGIGGAIYNSKGEVMSFFSEEIDSDFLEEVRAETQVTLIQELEMLALLVAVTLWCPHHKCHRVVAFTDSESVRGAFLKTWSNNSTSSHLLSRIFQVEEQSSCQIWIERVPSQSNPVDILSRTKTLTWMNLKRHAVNYREVWSKLARNRGKSATEI